MAGLLESYTDHGRLAYRPTPGLAVFVEALCQVPFPVLKWSMP
jgi:hypothetical protein